MYLPKSPGAARTELIYVAGCDDGQRAIKGTRRTSLRLFFPG